MKKKKKIRETGNFIKSIQVFKITVSVKTLTVMAMNITFAVYQVFEEKNV